LQGLVGIAGSAAVAAIVALVFALISRSSAIQSRNDVIAAQAEYLTLAKPETVPSILASLKRLENINKTVTPLLNKKMKDVKLTPTQVARIRLGLFAVAGDQEQVTPLKANLLESGLDLEEFLLLRDELAGQFSPLEIDRLWKDLPNKNQTARFRAVAALARFDAENKNWGTIGAEVAEQLLRQDSVALSKWIAALKPVQKKLIPYVEEIYKSQDETRAIQRPNAAVALSELLPLSKLTDLLVEHADSQATFRPLAAKLPRRGPRPVGQDFVVDPNEDPVQMTRQLEKVIEERPPEIAASGDGDRVVNQREALFQRQANAAVALLVSNNGEKVWPLLATSKDPTLRTHLIHRFQLLGIEPERLIPALTDSAPSVQQAVILALGEFPPNPMSSAELTSTASALLDRFDHDPDPGIHSAAEWTLNQWRRDARFKEIEVRYLAAQAHLRLAGKPASDGQRWYINKLRQTMIVVPKPGKIQTGSRPNELSRHTNEQLQEATIDWEFAIATKETKVRDLQEMAKDEQFAREFSSKLRDRDLETLNALASSQENVDFPGTFIPRDSNQENVDLPGTFIPRKSNQENVDLPAACVTWYLAAAYCNWLSQKDGLSKDQWCYAPNDQDKYDVGMTIKKWQGEPHLRGYRLPTEAEWEYVCRAGTNTRWSCGESVALLPRFACCETYALLPVGSLKPNDWGLFDTHGNVSEWCQDVSRGKYSQKLNVDLTVSDRECRALRGGSFSYYARVVRSTYRDHDYPDFRGTNVGFRVARTYP
jgi:formylglycine-generating enzyme required for sulfatase activity